jgi:ABC-2 type transport system permease protein
MLFSPYLLIKEWSMKISATDSRHFFEFEKQAEQYRYNLIQELNHLHAEKIGYHTNKTQRLDHETWRDLPTFSYSVPDFAWSTQASGFEKWIGIWWFLFLLLGLALIKRKGGQYAAS